MPALASCVKVCGATPTTTCPQLGCTWDGHNWPHTTSHSGRVCAIVGITLTRCAACSCRADRKRVIDKHTNLATALLKHIKASWAGRKCGYRWWLAFIGWLSWAGEMQECLMHLIFHSQACVGSPPQQLLLQLGPSRTASWTAFTPWKRSAWPTRPTVPRCAASCSNRWARPPTSCASRSSGCSPANRVSAGVGPPAASPGCWRWQVPAGLLACKPGECRGDQKVLR